MGKRFLICPLKLRYGRSLCRVSILDFRAMWQNGPTQAMRTKSEGPAAN